MTPLLSMDHKITANGALRLFFPHPNMLSSMLQKPFKLLEIITGENYGWNMLYTVEATHRQIL